MPLFLIITKLLLLKILVFNSIAYEYGYHPSAEEFDNLIIRGTGSPWTRNLIAEERRRTWHMPVSQRRSDVLSEPKTDTRAGEYFVPKFKYEKVRQPYESTLNLKWPGYAEKVVRKIRPTHNDQESATSLTSLKVVAPQNIGSSIDFTMFSDEVNSVQNNVNNYPSKPSNNNLTVLYHKPEIGTTNSESPFNKIKVTQIVSTTQSTLNADPLQFKPTDTHGTVIEIDNDSSERAQTSAPAEVPTWHDKYSLNNLYKNNSDAHFPIFFTNPVTGIVYAITEIGRMDENLTETQRPKNNNTIPIYITKEQYDRDIFLLHKQYESQCNKSSNISIASSTLSGSLTSTQRPQIIRLQKPATISKLPTAKLPINLKNRKPPPVMVQTEVTVNDQVQLPPLKRLQKLKSKKKKKKRPGRKPGNIPNQKFLTQNDDNLPQFITGKRTTTIKPTTNKEKLTTQLERPSLPTTTIFSDRPIAATTGYVIPKKKDASQQLNNYSNHRLKKRSLSSLPENPTDKPTSPAQNSNTTFHKISTRTEISKKAAVHRLPQRKKGPSYLSRNATSLEVRGLNTTIRFVKRKKNSTNNSLSKKNATNSQHSLTTERGLKDQTLNRTKINPHKKRKSTKRGQDDDSGFDLFDLLGDDDDDDDDDDEKYGDDSEYYYYDETQKVKITNNNSDDDNDEDSVEVNEDLKEQIAHDNSSSAEEGADFGALEEFDIPTEEQQEATPPLEVFSSETKNTYGKKRIRRRPASSDSSASYEDDDMDDDDDGGGIGGFFRMLFYPVQVAMGRIADTFSSTTGDRSDEEIEDKLIYTQYSSATNNINAEEEEEEQNNSLSSWFSSLFGFNRRTKKIGSTTAAPPPPEITETPSWFEAWFGLSGSKSSSSETSTSNEDYDDYDKWFSSWFSTKPKAKRRTTTTSTTTTATFPQVPILTIVDPMKNPQNWLGILAHHIINSTTTTTHNPLIEVLTRATTTENPDIPRFISYDKYQIWRLKPQNEAHVKALEDYKRTDDGTKLKWLKGPSLRGLTDVLVPPKMLIDFQGTLQFESIAHEILIFDVGKAIAYEQTKEDFYLTTPRPNKHQQKQKYASLINMSWNKYYEYDDIVKYLESVRMRHPQIVELFHIGRSYEGRPLVVVKLEKKPLSSTSNKETTQTNHKKLRHKKKSGQANAVFIEAGTHGLEWIGPATATWMINELLRAMKSNKTTTETDFIRNTTWYIMPVLNPDGYAYSHEYDRFWRKSRSRHISRPGGLINSAMTWLQQKKNTEKVCYGVDLDRNWNYMWGKRGSSKSPCNEYFAGPTSFSEPETKSLSDFLKDNRKQIKLYISMQAYGQIISYPSKANFTFNTERSEDFMDVAMAGVDGLRKKGNKSRYKIDSANDLLEQRAGCSDAFVAYGVGIPFSYTLYLADNGVHGYLLPSSSIETTARDAFEIIVSMLDYI